MVAASESSLSGALVFHDMSKGPVPIPAQMRSATADGEGDASPTPPPPAPAPANQSINASLLDFMSALERHADAHYSSAAGDERDIPGAEIMFFLHKCTMQLTHDEMCDLFRLSASEAEHCKFGTFEPDFLHVQRADDVWEISIIDAKVRYGKK